MSDDKIRILIVEARFYSDLADELLKGAVDAIEAYGAEYEVVTVPGALEIPAAIAIADVLHYGRMTIEGAHAGRRDTA